MSTMQRILATVALLLVALIVAGCGTPAATPAKLPADLLFVIPAGTAVAKMRGEPVVAIPERMEIVAGQGVTVRDEDQAMHYFFSTPIAPGQSVRKIFDQPGQYGYSGMLSCSIAQVDTVTVIVTPVAPAR
jgi:hypothetical protein